MEVPNLDCDFATPLELLKWARTFKPTGQELQPELLFPDMPEGYEDAAETLLLYAKEKALAMSSRLRGAIPDAIRHELNCELLYVELPPYARW